MSDKQRFSLPDVEQDRELRALLERWHAPEPSEALDARVLSRYRREVRPHFWVRLSRTWLPTTTRRVGAWKRSWLVTACTLAALVLLQVDRAPRASAAELLRASREAEAALLDGSNQVLHRVVSVEERRRGEVSARRRVEVWRSNGASLGAGALAEIRRAYDERDTLVAGAWIRAGGDGTVYRRGAGPAFLAGSPTTLDINSVWRLEPSAKTFRALVGDPALAKVEETSTHYLIRFHRQTAASPAGSPELLTATITLLKPGLLPVEQTFRVSGPAGEREYRLTESSLRRVSAGEVEAAVLKPDAALLLPTPAASLPSGPRAIRRVMKASVLAALEVEAFHRLHKAGALLGAQIGVNRTPHGWVEVDVLAESDTSKHRLLEALRPLSSRTDVRVRVQTVEEALRQQNTSLPESVIVREVEIDRDEIPVYVALHSHFSRLRATQTDAVSPEAELEAEIRMFADRMLNTSRDALLHALALRRLAERFPPSVLQSLNAEALTHWRTMVRDYARGFRERTEAIRRELHPVFFPERELGDASFVDPSVDSVGEIGAPPELAKAIEALSQQALANDETIRSAFALSPSSKAVIVPREALRRALLRSERLASAIERER